MAAISPNLHLSPEEQALVSARDPEVEAWLQHAHGGNRAALEKLQQWAYLTARNYYTWKVDETPGLAADQVDELTNDFFLEFDLAWPRMRSATHYTRRLLKNHWIRYCEKKHKQKRREAPLQDADQGEVRHAAEIPDQPWEKWDDDELLQYHIVLQMLQEAKPALREVIALRLKDPPVEYRAIAKSLKTSETSIRMRVSRFYSAVRKRYARALQQKKNRYMG